MTTENIEFLWLDESHEISIDQLLELTKLPTHELHQLVECGALMPSNPDAEVWQFKSHWVATIQTLTRLKQDFELEPNGMSLALVLLEKIRRLEVELKKVNIQTK